MRPEAAAAMWKQLYRLLGECHDRQVVICTRQLWSTSTAQPRDVVSVVATTTTTVADNDHSNTASNSVVKSTEKIPGPLALPIIGSLWRYNSLLGGRYKKNDWHRSIVDLYRHYGPVVQEQLGPTKRIVHVYDPDDIQALYKLEGRQPEIPPLQETVETFRASNSISLGLGNTNGDEWYRLRSAIHKLALRPRSASAFMSVTTPIACEFVDRVSRTRDSQTHVLRNFSREIMRWSLESSVCAITQQRLGALRDDADRPEHRVQRMLDANELSFCLSGMLKLSMPFYRYGWLRTPKWKKMSEAETLFYKNIVSLAEDALAQIDQIVRQPNAAASGALETVDANGYSPYLFIRTLLARSGSEQLSHNDILVLCLSFISDGLKTTVPQMIFNLHNLACSPHAQQRLFEEIQQHVVTPQLLTLDTFEAMPYLRACVRETFRLQPTNFEVSRYFDRDVAVKGYRIPAGTHVDFNAFVHYRDARLFPEPDKFFPERWLRDVAGTQSIHPFLKQPFGHGPRMCAGRRLAEQDLYTMLCLILQRYRLVAVDDNGREDPQCSPDTLPVQCYILPTPARDARIAFHDRLV